ncbi:HAMP domain-containing sensor histidine kinase [Paenibacillus sp. N3.4]|uniref:sensor histidine kinase n=1 Tax=Paenibacillus sp. N3.4 TaxID=2603222 RepID=UPI00164F35E3|nr:HAMP domain-containing sensor histidine kinase [Paenibacillus sp. N3.4]
MSYELHGLFYIMSAIFIHLVLTPIFLNNEKQLKYLFAIILIALVFLYWGFEDINPYIYSLHLFPVCLIIVLLFLGITPSWMTWICFNIGCLVLFNHFSQPVLVSSSILLISGYIRKHATHKQKLGVKLLYATGMLIMYDVLYVMFVPQLSLYAQYTMLLSFPSVWMVTYLLFYVKKNEVHKQRLLLLEKDRMIGQMAATISHEVRNPLTSTRGFLQLLAQKEITVHDHKRYMELALSGIDQATTMISDYLNYAKPAANLQEQLDMKAELDAILRFITPYATQRLVTIELSHETEAPLFILGDSKKLRQCLINLLNLS